MVCYPGTTELGLLKALSKSRKVKVITCLAEGIATGAADGFGRMASVPAGTLLHLGSGLANGLSNLHNAKKAYSPVVNIIGDHPNEFADFDFFTNSDVELTAAAYSGWTRRLPSVEAIPSFVEQLQRATAGVENKIATLVVPVDVGWSKCSIPPTMKIPETETSFDHKEEIVTLCDALLSPKPTALILGGNALYGIGLRLAGEIANRTGAILTCHFSSGRIERGQGAPDVKRIPTDQKKARMFFAEFETVGLIGAEIPRPYFARRGISNDILNDKSHVITVVQGGGNTLHALNLIQEVLSNTQPVDLPQSTNLRRFGQKANCRISTASFATVLASNIPDDAIVVDEGVTSSRLLFEEAKQSLRHQYLVNVGGALGAGLPLSIGAAIAEPERTVLCILGDGAANYSFQALWTIANQHLSVIAIVCVNNKYAILDESWSCQSENSEHKKPLDGIEICNPSINWCKLAEGYGVEATSVSTVGEFESALRISRSLNGPFLIQVNFDSK